MAEVIAIEPALFRKDEAWFIFDDGRKCLRKLERPENKARSSLPAPAILSDSCEPTRGADGKMYDSLSAYRRTLKPDGNPMGERFLELGNEELPAFQKPKFDEKQRREDIQRAVYDVENSHVPTIPQGPDL